MMKTSLLRILLAPLLVAVRSPPASRSTSPTRAGQRQAQRRAHQDRRQGLAGAVDELKRVNDPASADWNNLMGYSLRKAGAANAAESETLLQRGAAHRSQAHAARSNTRASSTS